MKSGEIAARPWSGRMVGAMFFTGFGTLWTLTGLGALHYLHGWVAVVVLACGGLLLWLEWRKSARLEALEGPVAPTPEQERARRVFRWANVAQWVAIPLVVVGLGFLRRPEWIVPGIATVVGLHLLPLARAFHSTTNLVVGLLLIAWSAGCVLLMPRWAVPGWGALGTAALLLSSAVITLVRASGAERRLSGEGA